MRLFASDLQTPFRTIQTLFVGGQTNSFMFLGDSNSTPPSGPESLNAVSPSVFLADSDAFGLTFSNKNDDVDVDVEFYVNASLIFTWQIRNSHVATKTSGLSALTFNAGDRLGIFLQDVATGSNVDQASIEVISVINTATLVDTSVQII